MTWDGIVTKYHKRYLKKLGVTPQIEAYIQTVVLKKTTETISFEKRRGLEVIGAEAQEFRWECAVEKVIEGAQGGSLGSLEGEGTHQRSKIVEKEESKCVEKSVYLKEAQFDKSNKAVDTNREEKKNTKINRLVDIAAVEDAQKVESPAAVELVEYWEN